MTVSPRRADQRLTVLRTRQGKRILERYRARKRRGESIAGLLFKNVDTPVKGTALVVLDKENVVNSSPAVHAVSASPAPRKVLSVRSTPGRTAQAAPVVAGTRMPETTAVATVAEEDAGGEARDLLAALDRAMLEQGGEGAAAAPSRKRVTSKIVTFISLSSTQDL